MKTTLVYSLAFALAATLAATGCKHTPGRVTPMSSGLAPAAANDQVPTTRTSGSERATTYNPPNGPETTGVALANSDLINDMIPDPAALAAFTIHFAYDSAAIRKSEQANLQEVAKALSADSKTKVLVEGNCDERGTEEYNRSLGERRALASREALAKLGVDPTRVFVRSYGKDKPADPGHDEAAWQKNRRDDFVLLHPKPGA